MSGIWFWADSAENSSDLGQLRAYANFLKRVRHKISTKISDYWTWEELLQVGSKILSGLVG